MAGRSAHPSVESAGEVTGSGARWPLSARVEGFARDAARVERAIAGRVMKQHRLGVAVALVIFAIVFAALWFTGRR